MNDLIHVSRAKIKDWHETIRHVESVENERHNHNDLLDCIAELENVLATPAQPISSLRAEVMALQPAPFISSLLGKTIVDANNKAIGYARGITILQQDEMLSMVCEAINEYWARHKI